MEHLAGPVAEATGGIDGGAIGTIIGAVVGTVVTVVNDNPRATIIAGGKTKYAYRKAMQNPTLETSNEAI